MEIKQVILQTAKLNQLYAFYSNLFGSPAVLQINQAIKISIGSSELVFKQVRAADPFYHFAINIPANKIEEARNWLLEKNIALLQIEDYKSDIADFVNWHAKSVYFLDPAGNVVELIARFDLNNSTTEVFSSALFLSVSEIGLVVEESKLEETAESLLQQYHLSWFDKQAPLPKFKVIGDDKGLFILVPEKRNWYPTVKPSGIFPMEIAFETNGRSFTLQSS